MRHVSRSLEFRRFLHTLAILALLVSTAGTMPVANAAAAGPSPEARTASASRGIAARAETRLPTASATPTDMLSPAATTVGGYRSAEYQEWVLSQLQQADDFAQGDKDKFFGYLDEHLKAYVRNNPDMLDKGWWNGR